MKSITTALEARRVSPHEPLFPLSRPHNYTNFYVIPSLLVKFYHICMYFYEICCLVLPALGLYINTIYCLLQFAFWMQDYFSESHLWCCVWLWLIWACFVMFSILQNKPIMAYLSILLLANTGIVSTFLLVQSTAAMNILVHVSDVYVQESL